jgi:hypothetical protein
LREEIRERMIDNIEEGVGNSLEWMKEYETIPKYLKDIGIKGKEWRDAAGIIESEWKEMRRKLTEDK